MTGLIKTTLFKIYNYWLPSSTHCQVCTCILYTVHVPYTVHRVTVSVISKSTEEISWGKYTYTCSFHVLKRIWNYKISSWAIAKLMWPRELCGCSYLKLSPVCLTYQAICIHEGIQCYTSVYLPHSTMRVMKFKAISDIYLIMAVTFLCSSICGGNQCTRRKPLTCHNIRL